MKYDHRMDAFAYAMAARRGKKHLMVKEIKAALKRGERVDVATPQGFVEAGEYLASLAKEFGNIVQQDTVDKGVNTVVR